MKIGFVGLGHMGNPMAQNLIKSGYEIYVYDVNTDAIPPLTAQGAIAMDSLATLGETVDVAITSVQTGQQVSDICLGYEGLFSKAKSKLLFIDCSSIDIVTTVKLHDEASKLNIDMVDAPVSGGVAAAVAGSLTFMVGGSDANFQRAKPILEKMGKKIIHAGPAGHGGAAKICNNLLLAISMIGVCEAFTLADKLGLNQKKLFEICANASGQCWSLTNYCPVPGILDNVPASHNYQPGFMAKMMLKDLRLGQHAAEAVDATIPLGAVATELYELYVSQGHGEKDFSGIINLLRNGAE